MNNRNRAGRWIRTVFCRSLVSAFALMLTVGTPVLAQKDGAVLTMEDDAECIDYSSPELVELSSGDGEYWKYYDTEGKPLSFQDGDGSVLSVSEALDSSYGTIESPFTHVNYTVKGEYGVRHCIDVSKYQQDIDWKKVKASGIDYAIIRCGFRSYTTGKLYEDERFHSNMKGALAAGMKVGVYIFSQALTEKEAVEEAAYCLDTCRSYLDQVDLPVVIDYEYVPGGRLTKGVLNADRKTAICSRFCQVVHEAGLQPMVYANKSLLNEDLNPRELTSKGYSIWLANYISKTTYSASAYSIWQYSEKGSVPGINENTDMDFVYPDDLSAALDLKLANDNPACPVLTWKSRIGAEGYEIQTSPDQTSWKTRETLDAGSRISWQDSAVGGTVYYRIRTVYSADGTTSYGKWSDAVVVTNQMQAPVINEVECVDSHTLKISWNSVNGAAAYQVDRKTAESDWEILDHVEGTSCTDRKVVPNTTYIYRVRAVAGTVEHVEYGLFSREVAGTATLGTPALKKAETLTCTSIRITWNAVKDAEGYRIYRRETDGSWKVLTDQYQGTSYTDTNAKCGTSYYYTVRAYRMENDTVLWGDYERPGILGQATPAMVKSIKVTSANYRTLKISWKKVDGAQGYRIYRKKKDGKWSRVDDVGASVTQYKDSNGIKCGETWYYTVRCYHISEGKVVLGTFNNELASGKAVPATPSVKLSASSKGAVNFSWKKIDGADGYIISARVGNEKNWNRVATIKSGSQTSCRIKAASGVTIQYKVCAYRKVNGKTYFSDSQSGLKAAAK